mgnify:CR=1 FL=1
MKYKKVICINVNGDSKLIINKIYIGKKYNNLLESFNNKYFIYDDDNLIDLYPDHMFKEVKLLRKERLNDILNEI